MNDYGVKDLRFLGELEEFFERRKSVLQAQFDFYYEWRMARWQGTMERARLRERRQRPAERDGNHCWRSGATGFASDLHDQSIEDKHWQSQWKPEVSAGATLAVSATQPRTAAF